MSIGRLHMGKLFKNYRMSIILILSVIIGGIVGLLMGPEAKVLEPFGQIYLNLIFTLIVPLVFFGVTSAISNMTVMKRLGKILVGITLIFAVTALLAGLLALIGVLIFDP